MELEASPAGCRSGRLSMAAITHVFTIARVAKMLGEDEDRLHEISIEMEPEDGVIHIYGIGDDGITAFTDFGVENLRELLQIDNRSTEAALIGRLPNIMGVGIVAGGPYGCSVAAADSAGDKGIEAAITKCSEFMALTCNDLFNGPLAQLAGLCDKPYTGPATDEQARELASRTFALAQATAAAGQIDAPANIARARVYLFTGTNDEIVPYDG